MPSFSYNIDKCFFSRKDTCFFLQKDDVYDERKKSKLIQNLAPKHKVTAIEFNAGKNIDIEDIVQAIYHEVEMLIGFDVGKNLSKYSNEKKIFVLVELLKDCAIIIYMSKPVSKDLLVQLQRLSLTLKRYTRSRLRLLFICDITMFDHCIDAGLRLEYVKLYFNGLHEKKILEIRHSIDAEIKLERRGIDRFLGEYIETVKLRPRVKSFLSNS